MERLSSINISSNYVFFLLNAAINQDFDILRRMKQAKNKTAAYLLLFSEEKIYYRRKYIFEKFNIWIVEDTVWKFKFNRIVNVIRTKLEEKFAINCIFIKYTLYTKGMKLSMLFQLNGTDDDVDQAIIMFVSWLKEFIENKYRGTHNCYIALYCLLFCVIVRLRKIKRKIMKFLIRPLINYSSMS